MTGTELQLVRASSREFVWNVFPACSNQLLQGFDEGSLAVADPYLYLNWWRELSCPRKSEGFLIAMLLLLVVFLGHRDELASTACAAPNSASEFSVSRRFNSLEATDTSFSPLIASLCLSSEMGVCVTGSMPLCLSFFFRQEFHRFLISLSVLPGNCAAIWDHLRSPTMLELTKHYKTEFQFLSIRHPLALASYLFPRTAWSSIIRFSSSWEKVPLFKSGLK